MKGFIDIQINGFSGVDFSAPDLTVDSARDAARALVAAGTWAFCPTIITGDPSVTETNIRTIIKAFNEPPYSTHFLGIHLEGPFISGKAGYKGAHKTEYTTPPDRDLFERFYEAADGQIALLTLAPEYEGAADFIRAIKDRVAVSIGHANPDGETLRAAVNAGATLFTHLGNGAANMMPRHPNILQEVLVEDGLTAGLITDGHHLPPSFIQLALRAKGIDRCYLTCDCSPIAGFPPGRYHSLGRDVVLEETGRLALASGECLAGSAATTLMCVNHTARITDLSYDDLLRLSIDTPLRAIGAPFPAGEGIVPVEITYDASQRRFSVTTPSRRAT